MNTLNSVLVTGGTGTFGEAFIRKLLETDFRRAVIFSRGEHKQAELRQKFAEEFGGDSRIRWMVGDVRDVDRLKMAMAGVDTVIHAAALKRIETGFYNPQEMVKTNVLGAMNVINAAFDARVKRVVALSTDKAFQPISPYGQSKALAETLFLNANNMFGDHGPRFAVCRYGNIWGAQGSIVPLWHKLISEGKTTVPVSDLNCTRFFMRIDEAVDLVWKLCWRMRGGELAIPDWLPAYRVGDLLDAFGVDGEILGLPVWEKLHESMCQGLCSEFARRMSVDELRHMLQTPLFQPHHPA